MRFNGGEAPKYKPHEKWNPQQVISWYQQRDKPLNRSALHHHLLNLVGTSFLHTTTAGIQNQLQLQAQHPELRILRNPIDAFTLYTSMNGMNAEPLALDTVNNPDVKKEAKLALASALGQLYFPRYILYNPMRPDEMVFELSRYDDVYKDADSAEKAYKLITREAFYFKKGVLIENIAISSVYYYLPDGHSRCFR